MNGLVIHSILEFPFCLIKSTGSTFGYLTGERRLPVWCRDNAKGEDPAVSGGFYVIYNPFLGRCRCFDCVVVRYQQNGFCRLNREDSRKQCRLLDGPQPRGPLCRD